MRYNKLFEPISIGGLWVKNRIAMAPINNFHQMDPSYGTITQRCVEYYVERAKGGLGHIITGVFKVENEIERCMKDDLFQWPMLTEKSLPEYIELADYAHSFDVKIFVQLSAGPGRVTHAKVINSGVEPVSASDNKAFFLPEVTCRPLETEEVEEIVQAFGQAAEIVATAGLDGIEVHGHEGYLIDQFTTALWNRRNDKYGGDLNGRLRLPIDILQAIKKKVGDDFPVTYRYGVKHFIEEPWTASLHGEREVGRDLPESIEMAKILEDAGYDALHLDAGCYDSTYYAHPPNYLPHGFTADLVKEVKNAVSIPVLAASRLDVPEVAEAVLEQEKADVIVLGRALLADPDWPKKVFEGKLEDIRPCIACQEGCLRRPAMGAPLSCSVNPSCGREKTATPTLISISKAKKVVVVGGGVAGMEAARTAKVRGHSVTLYEKSEELGGHLTAISVPAFKKDIKRLLNWYKNQLDKLKIEIKLNTCTTPELIKEMDADTIILATGSTYQIPDIAGITETRVFTCSDLYMNPAKAGDDVAIIGGGLAGCETALWLAQEGKKVTVIEQLSDVAMNVFNANRKMLLDLLVDQKVKILVNTKAHGVGDNVVMAVDRTLKEKEIKCDTVVIAAGMRSEQAINSSLSKEISELYVIGDGKKPRKIHDAIFEGYIVGYSI